MLPLLLTVATGCSDPSFAKCAAPSSREATDDCPDDSPLDAGIEPMCRDTGWYTPEPYRAPDDCAVFNESAYCISIASSEDRKSIRIVYLGLDSGEQCSGPLSAGIGPRSPTGIGRLGDDIYVCPGYAPVKTSLRRIALSDGSFDATEMECGTTGNSDDGLLIERDGLVYTVSNGAAIDLVSPDYVLPGITSDARYLSYHSIARKGNSLAAASDVGTVYLVDAAGVSPERSYEPVEGFNPVGMDFLPSGDLALLAQSTLTVVDFATAQPLRTLELVEMPGYELTGLNCHAKGVLVTASDVMPSSRPGLPVGKSLDEQALIVRVEPKSALRSRVQAEFGGDELIVVAFDETSAPVSSAPAVLTDLRAIPHELLLSAEAEGNVRVSVDATSQLERIIVNAREDFHIEVDGREGLEVVRFIGGRALGHGATFPSEYGAETERFLGDVQADRGRRITEYVATSPDVAITVTNAPPFCPPHEASD